MFRRNFIKAMLSSPLALLGGKEEEFIVPTIDAAIWETYSSYPAKDGGLRPINFPEGKWQLSKAVFTRVKGE